MTAIRVRGNRDYRKYWTSPTSMKHYWGEKCEVFEATCPCCVAWQFFEKDGTTPSSNVVNDYLKWVEHNENKHTPTIPMWAQEVQNRRLSVRLVKHNGVFSFMAEAIHHDKYEWAGGATPESAVVLLVQRIKDKQNAQA